VDNFINSHEKPKAAAGPPKDKMTLRIILLSRAPKKDKMTLRITLIVKAPPRIHVLKSIVVYSRHYRMEFCGIYPIFKSSERGKLDGV
jgi:hypothetical protein